MSISKRFSGVNHSSPSKRRGRRSDGRSLHFEPLEPRQLLTIVVDTLADGFGPGTSLREAIDMAAPGETIQFSVTGQIQLNSLGHLFVGKDLTIEGPGSDLLTITAFDPTPTTKFGDGSRAFYLDAPDGVPTNVVISGVTITGADSNVAGGGIMSRANLVLKNCVIRENFTTSSVILGGGGIYSDNGPVQPNSLIIRDSVISGNVASLSEGGGVRARHGSLVIERTTVSNNSASHVGGGISAADSRISVVVNDSTVHSNSATTGGGGVFLWDADTTITNSTFSGNFSPGNGGGFFIMHSDLALRHSTITANRVTAGNGGGAYVPTHGNLMLDHSIISGNSDGDLCIPGIGCGDFPGDIHGSATARYSIIGFRTSGTLVDLGGNQSTTFVHLEPLANHGGPTLTHRPSPGSVAINSGDLDATAGLNGVPPHDQRGGPFGRVADGRIDIGAVELSTALLGDFDFDLDLDGGDIDMLVDAIVNAGSPGLFDLTGDGLVNLSDRDRWLELAGARNLPSGNAYLLGDANLDGVVDGSDFGVWNANKFTNVAKWTHGDFNADGAVDGTDFGVWNANKFQAADGARPLPTVSNSVREADDDDDFQKLVVPRLAPRMEGEALDHCMLRTVV